MTNQPFFTHDRVNDAYLPTPTGEPLISHAATRAVLYLVRNPLDVAVSLALGVLPVQDASTWVGELAVKLNALNGDAQE